MGQAAAGLYRSTRRGAAYDSVFSSGPTNLLAQPAYLGRVSEKRRHVEARVTILRDGLEVQRKELEARKAEADAAAGAARAARNQIAARRA